MNTLLHLTVDYPSIYRPINTIAVKKLIDELNVENQFVVVLTRTSNPFKSKSTRNGDILYMRYWGLPLGVLLSLSMFIVSLRVLYFIWRNKFKLSFIHAHKFTFEGIAAWFLSKFFNVQYFISVRGEADSKTLKYKKELFFLYHCILKDAKHIFYVSAWFKNHVNYLFDSVCSEKQSLLPNFVSNTNKLKSTEFDRRKFVTVLDLNLYKKKGLDALLDSFSKLIVIDNDYSLDIFGSGSEDIIFEIKNIIQNHRLTDNVFLMGSLDNKELISVFPRYSALLLPSHNETFGMVYVEALLSGLPILYSLGTGIDGFVDVIPAKIGVNPNSEEEILAGILKLSKYSFQYHEWLLNHNTEVMHLFDSKRYVKFYLSLIN